MFYPTIIVPTICEKLLGFIPMFYDPIKRNHANTTGLGLRHGFLIFCSDCQTWAGGWRWRGIIITATGDLDTRRDWRGYHCDYYFLRTGDMYLNLASDLSPGRSLCQMTVIGIYKVRNVGCDTKYTGRLQQWRSIIIFQI